MMIAIEKNVGRPTSFVALENTASVIRIDAFQVPEGIFCDEDSGIDQDTNSDSNASERHHIRGHMRVMHQEEGTQHGEWQRHRDDKDAAEVHEEDDMGERDEDDFFDQRMTKRIDSSLDQLRAVIERNDMDTGRKTVRDLLELLLYPRTDL